MIIKFIITAVFYATTIVLTTFAIAITPFAPIINIFGLAIILISLRCGRDWLTKALESHDTSIIETAKHNLHNHNDYTTSKSLSGSSLIKSYQQKRLDDIIDRHYTQIKIYDTVSNIKGTNNYFEHRRRMNLFTKALIAFLIEQTYDSQSPIENLELIKISIHKLGLKKEDLEFIQLALKNALLGAKINKILKHEQSNIMLTIITSIIYSIGDIFSISGIPPIDTYVLDPMITFFKILIVEADYFKDLFNRCGFISENEKRCNEIIREIVVPQEVIEDKLLVTQNIIDNGLILSMTEDEIKTIDYEIGTDIITSENIPIDA